MESKLDTLNQRGTFTSYEEGFYSADNQGGSHQNGHTKPEPEPAQENEKGDPDPVKTRLEEHAAMLRSRIAKTLASLVSREKKAVDTARKLVSGTEHLLPVLAAGGGLVLLLGGAGYLLRRSSAAAQPPRPIPKSPLTRFLKTAPVAAKASEQSIASEIFRGVVVSVSTYAVAQAFKLGIAALLSKLTPSESEPHPEY